MTQELDRLDNEERRKKVVHNSWEALNFETRGLEDAKVTFLNFLFRR